MNKDEIISKLGDRWWRLNNLYYVKDKKGQKVLFRPNAIQKYIYDNLWFFTIILKARQLGFGVLYFSGEMSPIALQQRFVSAHSSIPLWAIRENSLSDVERIDMHGQINAWEDLGIKLKPGMISMTTVARECALNPDCDFIILDYLQRFRPPEGERYGVREQEVAAMARAASDLAVRRGAIVLALVQLNKDAIGKTPDLGDIRESDAIAQEATTVLLLQRDAHSTDPYAIECVLAKNRNGDAGVVRLRMDQQTWTLKEIQ